MISEGLIQRLLHGKSAQLEQQLRTCINANDKEGINNWIVANPPSPREDLWGKVRNTWIKAGSALKSLTSGRLGDTEQGKKILATRFVSCHGFGEINPCVSRAYNEKDKSHYCALCGCGTSDLARLSESGSEKDVPIIGSLTKLNYRYLECPRERPGFSNERKV